MTAIVISAFGAGDMDAVVYVLWLTVLFPDVRSVGVTGSAAATALDVMSGTLTAAVGREVGSSRHVAIPTRRATAPILDARVAESSSFDFTVGRVAG